MHSMKKYLLFLSLFFFLQTHAQRITVSVSASNLGDGLVNAYVLSVPHVETKELEHQWKSFLKQNSKKVKTPGDEINSENTIIRLVGRDTFQVYSKVSENSDGSLLTAAFKKNDGFLSPSIDPEQSTLVEKLLHDFALPLAQDGLKDKIRAAEKALNSTVKDNQSLTSHTQRLRDDNLKMRSKISENERDISDNEKNISKLNSEVENKKNDQ